MQHGASADKVEAALGDYKKSAKFSPREKLALELCVRMTYTGKRVTDRFFNRLKKNFSDEELVELAAIIALENHGFCPVPAVQQVAAAATSRFHE
jgi:alkylhydroperoxidase family enzyme